MNNHTPRHTSEVETFAEAAAVVAAPAIYGPPISFLLGPWLLLVLLLAPPFALLFTIVLVLAVAAVLIVAAGLVLASPYLLVRHLQGRTAFRPQRLAHLFHRGSAKPIGHKAPEPARASHVGTAHA
jgi:hypothetical protein